MNFLDTKVAVENDKVYLLLEDKKILMPKEKSELLKKYDGQTVVMGIRPE